MGYFGAYHTPNGYVNADATSALQKAIRRGQEEQAIVFACEIADGGYPGYVWNRLRIITSEDVGIGEPEAVVQVRTLYDNWVERVAKEKDAKKAGRPLPPDSRIFLIQAVQVLARARKCRMVDHAYMLFYEGGRGTMRLPKAGRNGAAGELDPALPSTEGGHAPERVLAALGHELRAGNERESLFWATELEAAGHGERVWDWVRTFASTDVGLADPSAFVQVRALYLNWAERWKKEAAAQRGGRAIPPESRLYLLHAIQVLARAQKSSSTKVLKAMYGGKRPQPPVPDEALDGHTYRGKKMGRGPKFFLEVASLLENEAELDDPYREEGHRAHLAHFGAS